jgi:hypothetical protein
MKDFFRKLNMIRRDCGGVFLKLFWYRKFSVFLIYSGIILNLASWIVLWQLTKLNQEIIILHYNAYLGIDVMLDTEIEQYFDLFLVPIGGIVVLFLDILLAGILLYLSGTVNEQLAQKCGQDSEESDENLLGSNLIIIGGFLTQLVIFIYAAAILFVN